MSHPLDTSNFRAIKDDEEIENHTEMNNEDLNTFKDFKPISRPEKQPHAL